MSLRDVANYVSSRCPYDILGRVNWACRIEELQKPFFGSWAGDRVLCAGVYCKVHDYPASVEDVVQREKENPRARRENIYNIAETLYQQFDDYSSWRASDSRVMVRMRKLMQNGDEDTTIWDEDIANYAALVLPEWESDCEWVLCNLSKGEYVRQSVIQEIDQDERFPHNYDLGHAMLSRICWSSEASTSMRCQGKLKEPLHRGCWAGDRLEVTPIGKIRSDIEWDDVSEEVADTLRQIYRYEYEGRLGR
ncbi:hypothetical protein BC835DRAFT_1528887 [Cytidiella melzeri]|nr:hypothetical protein BC835DRAFT_1528887 [Cytidiella melzeri]